MCSLSIATNILKSFETSSSVGMFARDTGGCLISKLGLSRSKDEAKEVSFAEISESLIFYFGAPFVAKTTANIFSKNPNKQLGKFGQIMMTFGLVLPAVFGIAPLRNLMTYSGTGKDKFTGVIELEEQKNQICKDEAKEKASKLIKTLSAVSAGIVGAGAIITTLGKNPKLYKKFEPIVDKIVKYFSFKENGDLNLAHYGALIYPVSIASYFYASRDEYEKAENTRRFSITVPLMFFGEKLIQNPIYKKFDKIFKTNVMENGNIKSYKEILQLPKNQQKQMLKSKNWAYGSTFLINTMAIAAAVALLNRAATKQKFERDKMENTK